MFFKNAQASNMIRLIGAIILLVALFLIIALVLKDKLSQLFVSKYV